LEADFVHQIGCHGNVPRGIEKNNFRSFIYGQSSNNSANFAKIGPVDVEIIGLTEITKIYFETTAKHKPSSPALRVDRVG